ncbi:hypothetical protein [Kineococcus indalonis]|nr:hypothetical protein [Kineococcus indalonis]NAZ84846.1 hypothetical protein [Kineococcus indalonis]
MSGMKVEDLSGFGPELDEDELLVVTGGAGQVGSALYAKGTGGPCGGCH